jgi:diacylglycerol kinase (ATP)
MKRARIIYNPTSGREAIKRDLLEVIRVYESAGYETSTFATEKKKNSAADEAKRAAQDGFDLLVAAGGDGTVNEIINGISGLKKRPKLAILPAGTTNDYARALKIPRDDLVEAAKIINKKQSIKMDIGKANRKYFMNIAAMGTLSEVTYNVSSLMKSMIGYLAYLTRGAEVITRLKNVPVKIKYDEGQFEGEVAIIFLALTNSVGGFEQIVPDAKLDDGKFSLLIIKKANLAELLKLATEAAVGRHINDPLVEYVKSEKVVVTPISRSKLEVNLDGDFGGIAPVTFINLKRHIEIIAWTSKMKPGAKTAEVSQTRKASQRLIKASEKLK